MYSGGMSGILWIIALLFVGVVYTSEVRRRLEETLSTNQERRMLSEIYSKYDPDYVDRYMISRRRLELAVIERSNVSSRHRSWQVLTEVDGLKNTEIASFVTSTSAHDESLLWERLTSYDCAMCLN